MKDFILHALAEVQNGYSFCGVVDRRARVFPLSADTKLISILFEIVARRVVLKYADENGLLLKEPEKQNYYPDFTLMRDENDEEKIAIDVKTTYRETCVDRFQYTLGSYTSYIRPNTETKNIVFPYSQYAKHWIVGFVYIRMQNERNLGHNIYSFDMLNEIPVPFENVEVFMQEKWRIAGDRAGSGNTTNIGSIRGTMEDFTEGRGVFHSENEFLDYWRGYGRTAQEREYRNVQEFRNRDA